MRPGGLDRRGLGFEALRAVNPKIVFVTISGYGMTGPYRDMPSHGIAYDVWAGIVAPKVDENGDAYMPEHVSIGINAGPGVRRARAARRRAARRARPARAASSRSRSRTRPPPSTGCAARPTRRTSGPSRRSPATRPTTTSGARPGTAGMEAGVRYQFYATTDGYVLFMASEREFWKNFCEGVGRPDLFERWPGAQYGDHARGNTELRAILREIFASRSSAEWLEFGMEHNTPIAPSNTPKTIADDPQFRDRMPWIPASAVGADMLPTPIKFVGETLPEPTMAPTVGEHTEAVLRDVLGWDDDRIAAARDAGAFGAAGS